MKKNKSTIAITGGAGRIGSAVAHDLIQKGYNVLLGDVNKKELTKIQNAFKFDQIDTHNYSLVFIRKLKIDSVETKELIYKSFWTKEK